MASFIASIITQQKREQEMIKIGLETHLSQPRVWHSDSSKSMRNGYFLDGAPWAITMFSNYGMLETGLFFQVSENDWRMVECPIFGYSNNTIRYFDTFVDVANHMNYISELLNNSEKRVQAIQEANEYLSRRDSGY